MSKQVRRTRTLLRLSLAAAVLGGAADLAHAVDGVILIDQAAATAGGVTTGDAAGFPVTLSQAGSYRLSGNLTVPNKDTTAIAVTADNVTIDLNGFAILGPNIANGLGTGVDGGSRSNVHVLNGTVRGMGSRGVYLGNKARAERLRLISNSDGLTVGVDALAQDITALENRVTGIFLFGRSSLFNSVANNNGEDGVLAGDGCLVQGSIIHSNNRYGIVVGNDSTVLQNTVTENGDFGLLLDSRTGYGQNVVVGNKVFSGPQVSSGIQLGTNVCGTDTVCP
jgi:hypothetical protein